MEAIRDQSVFSLPAIEQRGISEHGFGGKRTLVCIFFKERIPQTDRDCTAGTAYVRSTVHVLLTVFFRAETNITHLGKKSVGILASEECMMRASTIFNLSHERLSKTHVGGGDVKTSVLLIL